MLSGEIGGPEWNGRLPLSDVGQPGVAVDPHGPTASQCPRGKARRLPRQTGGSEMQAHRTVVGVDTAKRVFQLHWVELETGEMVDLRLSRAKFLEHFANRAACLVGMEACGGAQHCARRLRALGHHAPGEELGPPCTIRNRTLRSATRVDTKTRTCLQCPEPSPQGERVFTPPGSGFGHTPGFSFSGALHSRSSCCLHRR